MAIQISPPNLSEGGSLRSPIRMYCTVLCLYFSESPVQSLGQEGEEQGRACHHKLVDSILFNIGGRLFMIQQDLALEDQLGLNHQVRMPFISLFLCLFVCLFVRSFSSCLVLLITLSISHGEKIFYPHRFCYHRNAIHCQSLWSSLG